MLSRTVDKKLRLLAEALWLRSKIIRRDEKRNWLYRKEVMREIRRFFKHSQTRESYFQYLLDYGFLKKEIEKIDMEERTGYVPVEPSVVETRDIHEYLESLRKQLEGDE